MCVEEMCYPRSDIHPLGFQFPALVAFHVFSLGPDPTAFPVEVPVTVAALLQGVAVRALLSTHATHNHHGTTTTHFHRRAAQGRVQNGIGSDEMR